MLQSFSFCISIAVIGYNLLVQLQALPMVTVAVGKLNNLNVCRIETDPASKATDDPKYVEFNVPSASNMIEPGNPKWANYVKGVVAGFHGD